MTDLSKQTEIVRRHASEAAFGRPLQMGGMGLRTREQRVFGG
jgi:hypothetical protein